MVNQSDEPLTKVTVNLYLNDVAWYRDRYDNWSDAIRQAIRFYRRHIDSWERDRDEYERD